MRRTSDCQRNINFRVGGCRLPANYKDRVPGGYGHNYRAFVVAFINPNGQFTARARAGEACKQGVANNTTVSMVLR